MTTPYWTLETRICKCGCKRTFKCLPSSESRYASKKCEEQGIFKEKIPAFIDPEYVENSVVYDKSDLKGEVDL